MCPGVGATPDGEQAGRQRPGRRSKDGAAPAAGSPASQLAAHRSIVCRRYVELANTSRFRHLAITV